MERFLPRVGVDLVQVSEVASSLDRLGEAYSRRIFTAGEISYCAANPTLAPARYAARFAAKEATLKALHLEDEGLDLRSIEVKQTPGGWCELLLHGAAKAKAEAAGWASWSLSLSHEGDQAAAVVVVLANDPVVLANDPVVSANDPVVLANDPVVSANDPAVLANEPATSNVPRSPR